LGIRRVSLCGGSGSTIIIWKSGFFQDRGRDHREKVKEKEIPLKDQTGFKGEEGEEGEEEGGEGEGGEGGEGEGEVEDKGKRPPKTEKRVNIGLPLRWIQPPPPTLTPTGYP